MINMTLIFFKCSPLPGASFEGFELLVSSSRSRLSWPEGCGLLSSAAHPLPRDKTAAV